MNPSPPPSAQVSTELSRRSFVIGGSAAAALVWLNSPGQAAHAQTASTAAEGSERPHRTLLGVL